MPTDLPTNSEFLHVISTLADALGHYDAFATADAFYATVEPSDRQHRPLILASWPFQSGPYGSRRILVAHYQPAHGRLRPCPEYVVTDQGVVVWIRTRSAFMRVHPDDTSCDHLLTSLTAEIREHYISQATRQGKEGRAGMHLVAAEEVWAMIAACQNPTAGLRARRPVSASGGEAYLMAFDAFLSHRDAVKAALIQSTMMALREEPEALYLVCEASGTWCTLAERDLAQRLRWQRQRSGSAGVTVQLPTVAEHSKLQYSRLFEDVTGEYGGFVTDRRTLPDLAFALQHSVHEFLAREVEWYLDTLIADLRDQRVWFELCQQQGGDQDEDGDNLSKVIL